MIKSSSLGVRALTQHTISIYGLTLSNKKTKKIVLYFRLINTNEHENPNNFKELGKKINESTSWGGILLFPSEISKVGSLGLAECPVGFEPATFQF